MNTLRYILVHPKEKTPDERKCEMLYKIIYKQDSNHTYIGESKRHMAKRLTEHRYLKQPTAVGKHIISTGHSVSVSMETTMILSRESQGTKRTVKEAVVIRKHQPTINRDQGYVL